MQHFRQRNLLKNLKIKNIKRYYRLKIKRKEEIKMKKRIATVVLITAMSLSIMACGGNSSEPKTTPESEPATNETILETESAATETVSETIVETENEDPLGFSVMFSDSYRNDVTGNWRLSRIAEDINIEEYALDYYKYYFQSDSEIHIIVNFTRNTTTRINVIGNLLDVSIMDYVDGEEHDAKLACSGTLLSEYHIDIETGEIEKIQ